jgi:beta-lactamase regulating signal transducer with metallopeptidase domain
MPAFIELLNRVAAVWSERMWAVTWQSAILAVAVAIMVGLFLGRAPPSIRYWVWQILALKLLLMPFWTFALPLPHLTYTTHVNLNVDTGKNPTAERVTPVDPRIGTNSPPDVAEVAANTRHPAIAPRLPRVTWQSWLLAAWSGVVLAQIGRLFWQRDRLQRLLGESTPGDAALAGLIAELAAQIDLRKAPRVVLTGSDCSPFVCGLRDAVLVMPAGLAPSLSPTELRHVLLHELAHLRRRDLVWGWISELARVVYFFHPVVQWITYRARLERELACDQLAMSHSGQNAQEYASTLVRVVSHASEPTVFKTAAGSAGFDGESR